MGTKVPSGPGQYSDDHGSSVRCGAMGTEAVERWMEAYRAAWISNVPSDVAALFTKRSSTGMSSPATSAIRSRSSTTASSRFASRRMGAARSIASGTSDASSRGEPPALPLGDLEHGADVWSREEHTVGREAN